MSKLPIVAAFDFDATLTYRDSLFPFLLFTHGYYKAFLNFLICTPILIGYVMGLRNRQQTKERILKQFYQGRSLSEMQKWGKEYVERGIEVKPEAMERLRWHQHQGHRCVIVSASIDVYLNYWGAKMGIADVLCSQVEVSRGQMTGKLIGHNCRAEEKVRRLEKLLGPKENYILYAYGDSQGDRQMIDLADYPFYRVFG